MLDYWLDLIEFTREMVHPFFNAICGKRYKDGVLCNYPWDKEGEKCGGLILNIDNELRCIKCGAFFGNARKMDKKQGEQGLIALLEEVIDEVKNYEE